MARVTNKNRLNIAKRKKVFSPLTFFMFIVLILFCIILLGVIIWSLLISLTKNFSFIYNRTFDLKDLNFENFKTILSYQVERTDGLGHTLQPLTIWQVYGLSFLYATMCAFTNTLVPCLTAYFTARYKYKLSNIIYTVVMIAMVVPIIGSLPSEIAIVRALGLYDKIYVLWIMKANFLGLYYLIFHDYFKSLPDAYFEAAKIDGAGNLTLLFKIAFPMVINMFLTVFLIHFVEFWNEYQPPMVYMKSYPTVGYLLFSATTMAQGKLKGIPAQLALSFFMFIPTLILFACSHKKLMGNLTIGGIKG